MAPLRIRLPIIRQSQHFRSEVLLSSQQDNISETTFDVSAWLNPNTRGGVITWSVLLILIPIAVNNFVVSTGNYDPNQVGAYVGVSFVLLSNLLWASTYIFRVAKKDMTYAKQLRDYENAVLQKRLEELADDEINALMDEIESEVENSKTISPIASVIQSESTNTDQFPSATTESPIASSPDDLKANI